MEDPRTAARPDQRADAGAIPRYRIAASTSLARGFHDQDLVAASRAEGRFWEIEGGHDLMISEPDAVAGVLTEIASTAVRGT
ncbi:hypothetical protein NKH77_07195 [Streptomyces sp. M19]